MLSGALVNASVAVALGPTDVVIVLLIPSQHLHAVLRRPLESTQYLSLRYTERLAQAGIEPSVGSKGDSYDNALAETVIGLYKTELICLHGPWTRFADIELATLEWVWWFNNHRLLEPIGDIPPAEYEEQYHSRQAAQSVGA